MRNRIEEDRCRAVGTVIGEGGRPQPRGGRTVTSEYVATACPHDCPSTCALEVERLAPDRIGAVRGARENDYTSGVICAKVARYAERVHHPGRLAQPLQRTGEKGAGAFRPIGWDDALDQIAERLRPRRAEARSRGGLALLLRRHHGPGAARRHQPPAPRQEIFAAGRDHLLAAFQRRLVGRSRHLRGRRPARDGEGGPDRRLGLQSGVHPGQRDDPHREGAEDAGRGARSWSTPTRRAPPRLPTITLR